MSVTGTMSPLLDSITGQLIMYVVALIIFILLQNCPEVGHKER